MMNRQIKFRAWINGKMEFEPRIPFPNDETSIPVNEMFDSRTLMYGEPINWMQYTGLKDKNGKEIYEGDVIKFCHWQDCDKNPNRKWKVGYIEYIHDRFSIRPEQPMDSIYESKMYEIIGNIYENSELLK